MSNTVKAEAIDKKIYWYGIIGAVIAIALATITTLAINQNLNIDTENKSAEEIEAKTETTNTGNLSPNAYPFPSSANKKNPSSYYGFRIDPFTHQYKHHAGLDYSLPAGTPVLAAGDGKVQSVGYDQYHGQYVSIEHANGYVTKYSHLKLAYAITGNQVKQGQQIGEVGSTGRSTSPHLHFEVKQNNLAINPLLVVNQESNPTLVASNSPATTIRIKDTSQPTLQRVAFITNSGVTYRRVTINKNIESN